MGSRLGNEAEGEGETLINVRMYVLKAVRLTFSPMHDVESYDLALLTL